MAKLSSNQHLVASLNVMVASRNGKEGQENQLNNDEIASILLAMGEAEAQNQRQSVNRGRWHSGFGRAS
jgi:hypothetical protein